MLVASRPESGSSFSSVEEQLSIDMGVSYLPVTPGVSQYYGLTVDSGALVTEVVPGSISERAGLKVGDVIVAFNDTVLGEEVSLLGVIRTCPAGNPITLEFWRGTSRQKVELVHTTDDGGENGNRN
jgi:serine protease Do